jgi:hypothetical protein
MVLIEEVSKVSKKSRLNWLSGVAFKSAYLACAPIGVKPVRGLEKHFLRGKILYI